MNNYIVNCESPLTVQCCMLPGSRASSLLGDSKYVWRHILRLLLKSQADTTSVQAGRTRSSFASGIHSSGAVK